MSYSWDSTHESFGETAKKDDVEREKRLVAITNYQQQLRVFENQLKQATTDEERKEISGRMLSLPVPWLNGKTHLEARRHFCDFVVDSSSTSNDDIQCNSSSTLGMTSF